MPSLLSLGGFSVFGVAIQKKVQPVHSYALGLCFSNSVPMKPMRNLSFKPSRLAFHYLVFTLEQDTLLRLRLTVQYTSSKVLRMCTHIFSSNVGSGHIRTTRCENKPATTTEWEGNILTASFYSLPFNQHREESWAKQCKNKQKNSSLQPEPTSPVIWEKYPFPTSAPVGFHL